jgi:lipopolysaccharide export system protein LptA
VEADRIDIDRAKQTFEAHGKVTSQLADKAKDAKSKTASPVFTVVRAPDLVYTGADKIALYQGGVSMTRPGMTVTGKELKAYMKETDGETSLDKAFADGGVKIVSNMEKRSRVGTSEHAEYYAGEEKVVLEGGDPTFVDSLKGQTRGKQLTWFSNSDRLLVNGAESRPADTILRKK